MSSENSPPQSFRINSSSFNEKSGNLIKALKFRETFSDVVLLADKAVEGGKEYTFPGHAMILAGCSGFFKDAIETAKRKQIIPGSPIILCLGGIGATTLQYILEFIYEGDVTVNKEDIKKFVRGAKILRVEGLLGIKVSDFLAGEDDDEDVEAVQETPRSSTKRRKNRRNEDEIEDDVEEVVLDSPTTSRPGNKRAPSIIEEPLPREPMSIANRPPSRERPGLNTNRPSSRERQQGPPPMSQRPNTKKARPVMNRPKSLPRTIMPPLPLPPGFEKGMNRSLRVSLPATLPIPPGIEVTTPRNVRRNFPRTPLSERIANRAPAKMRKRFGNKVNQSAGEADPLNMSMDAAMTAVGNDNAEVVSLEEDNNNPKTRRLRSAKDKKPEGIDDSVFQEMLAIRDMTEKYAQDWHNKNSPFGCKKCPGKKTVRNISDMRRHIFSHFKAEDKDLARRIHEATKKGVTANGNNGGWTCKLCKRELPSISLMEAHMSKMHLTSQKNDLKAEINNKENKIVNNNTEVNDIDEEIVLA